MSCTKSQIRWVGKWFSPSYKKKKKKITSFQNRETWVHSMELVGNELETDRSTSLFSRL